MVDVRMLFAAGLGAVVFLVALFVIRLLSEQIKRRRAAVAKVGERLAK